MDSHDSTKHYVNGPEAFLHTLLAELKDAEKRFRDINTSITKLVTPEVSEKAHLMEFFENIHSFHCHDVQI